MPLGFQAAQIVHASGDSVLEPLPSGTNAVVLGAPDEHSLRAIAKKLQLAGVQHVVIQEIDPPWSGQVTAIGIVPLTDRTVIRKILSSLPLLGKQDKLCSVQDDANQPVVQS